MIKVYVHKTQDWIAISYEFCEKKIYYEYEWQYGYMHAVESYFNPGWTEIGEL